MYLNFVSFNESFNVLGPLIVEVINWSIDALFNVNVPELVIFAFVNDVITDWSVTVIILLVLIFPPVIVKSPSPFCNVSIVVFAVSFVKDIELLLLMFELDIEVILFWLSCWFLIVTTLSNEIFPPVIVNSPSPVCKLSIAVFAVCFVKVIELLLVRFESVIEVILLLSLCSFLTVIILLDVILPPVIVKSPSPSCKVSIVVFAVGFVNSILLSLVMVELVIEVILLLSFCWFLTVTTLLDVIFPPVIVDSPIILSIVVFAVWFVKDIELLLLMFESVIEVILFWLSCWFLTVTRLSNEILPLLIDDSPVILSINEFAVWFVNFIWLLLVMFELVIEVILFWLSCWFLTVTTLLNEIFPLVIVDSPVILSIVVFPFSFINSISLLLAIFASDIVVTLLLSPVTFKVWLNVIFPPVIFVIPFSWVILFAVVVPDSLVNCNSLLVILTFLIVSIELSLPKTVRVPFNIILPVDPGFADLIIWFASIESDLRVSRIETLLNNASWDDILLCLFIIFDYI